MTALALVFQNTTFDVTDRNGQPWLKMRDMVSALYGATKGGAKVTPPLKTQKKP
jgi:prophage antirepressor-like protein